jgi:protein TonB
VKPLLDGWLRPLAGQPLGLGMGASLGAHLLMAACLLAWPAGMPSLPSQPETIQKVRLVELPPPPPLVKPPPPPPAQKPPPTQLQPQPQAPPRADRRPPSTTRPSPVFSAAQEKPVESGGPSVATTGEAIGDSGPVAAPAGGGQLPLGTEEVPLAGFDWGPYWREVRQRIEARKDYPAAARRHGLEGRVNIDFIIDPQGRLLTASVNKSSGYEELDQAAIKAVQRAAPYPVPPQAPLDGRVKLEISIAFELL